MSFGLTCPNPATSPSSVISTRFTFGLVCHFAYKEACGKRQWKFAQNHTFIRGSTVSKFQEVTADAQHVKVTKQRGNQV